MSTLPIQRASASLRREFTHSRWKLPREYRCNTACCLAYRSITGIPSRCLASQAPADPQPATSLPKPRLNYKKMAANATYQSHNAFNRRAKIPIGAAQHIPRLYEKQKALTSILDEKRHARTVHGDKIRKASNASDRAELVTQAKALKDEIAGLENSLEEVEDSLYKLALAMPNDTHPDVPIGPESAAAVLAHHGPEPLPASPERDHVRIATQLGLVDLEAGAAVSGTSWYFLKNEGAILELALTNYAMSIAIKHGFTPVTTPDVVRTDIASRCGFQPRDEDANPPVSQMYHITQASSLPELVLAGTAEIPLAGMFANKILEEEKLPLKVVGLGRAFRAEAGARGADTRGLYRVHQFTKLELFAVSAETESEKIMEELKAIQTEIFSGLNLPFR